jgi:hypothetical protein
MRIELGDAQGMGREDTSIRKAIASRHRFTSDVKEKILGLIRGTP